MIEFENIRIMFITTTDNMIWQFLIPHIKDLENYGAKVDCFCAKTGFWFDELREEYKLNMIEIPFERSPFKLKNLKAYKLLKKYQIENSYNLIYCQQPVGGMMGRLIGKKFHIPVIYTAHGFFFFKNNNPLKNLIFKTAEKYLSKYTNVLLTMSSEDFQAIADWKVKYKYKINGIGFDNTKYDLTPFDKTKFKQEFNIEEGNKVIVTVAEFIKRKNYPAMIKSFAIVKRQFPNVKYIVCGTGKLENKIKSLVRKLDLEDSVIFAGYRKDINKIMQISDLMLLLSKQEGLTMAIMEAMYYSLPVVTSNVRGNRDLIDDSLGGKLVNYKNIDEVTSSVLEILDNEDLKQKMGEYNHIKVKKYEIDVVREQLKRVYEEVQF